MRLVGTSLECYKYLEPLYNDYRKMRKKEKVGGRLFYCSMKLKLNIIWKNSVPPPPSPVEDIGYLRGGGGGFKILGG